MISSRPEFNRVRPLMGTYLKIALNQQASDALNQEVNQAFAEASRLESIFSKYNEASNLNFLINAPIGKKIRVEPELYSLLKEAVALWRDSGHAFNPFDRKKVDEDAIEFHGEFSLNKKIDFSLDLNGIAKGYIVDLVASSFESSGFSGFINAGGDVRFFNTETKILELRVGTPERPLSREIQIDQNSIATSIPRHLDHIRPGLTAHHTVSVVSHRCAIADALTKVYIYGGNEDLNRCYQKYAAQLFVFSPAGELVESVT